MISAVKLSSFSLRPYLSFVVGDKLINDRGPRSVVLKAGEVSLCDFVKLVYHVPGVLSDDLEIFLLLLEERKPGFEELAPIFEKEPPLVDGHLHLHVLV
jgi:hypothetical protein